MEQKQEDGLAADRVSVQFSGGAAAVSSLSLSIEPGRVTVIAGPNGCGKSTLLRTLARLLQPSHGAVLLDGSDIHRKSAREVALRIGSLPQGAVVPEGMHVRDLVRLGRYPHQRWWQAASLEDERIVEEAMLLAGIAAEAERRAETLSGGERQRAWIAMALAQQTSTLLLDEPTTYLDMAHQLVILELLTQLNREQGKTIVLVLHDLNHAARYADRLVLMRDGAVVAQGHPTEVMTAARIVEVFDVEAELHYDAQTGRPTCIPLRVRRP